MLNPAKDSPAFAVLARYTTPLTVLLWAMIGLGMLDVFYAGIVPEALSRWNLILLWPVAAATYFGIRYRKKLEARAASGNAAANRHTPH